MKTSSKPNIIAIIPARMASSRFPGKPMAKIRGIPMIGHVYYRTRMSNLVSETYVATCDQQIFDYIDSIGGKAVMTADTHDRASERTAEAMQKVEETTGQSADIVVMVQGDEPMIFPEMLDEAVQPLIDEASIFVSNLMAPLKTREEHDDPNEVKVVVDRKNFALYFSREPIPSWKKGAQSVPMLKQVCIIPFQRDFLLQFNQMETTPLEIIESVDMLRIMEHGHKVKMVLTDKDTYSVDTLEDLNRVEKLMKNDQLMDLYGKKTG